MAAIHLPEFDLARPDLWKTWVKQLNCYALFHNIKDEETQKYLLLSACGLDTLALAKALIAPTTLQDATYEGVVRALTDHLVPRQTRMQRRLEFYSRHQKPSESVAAYVVALRGLARKCEFPNLDESLLDQFVVGIREDKLRWKLIVQDDLTLMKALQEAAAHLDTSSESEASDGEEAHQIQHPPRRKTRPATTARLPNSQAQVACASCGEMHECRSCRFRNATCWSCGKTGHIACVCRTKGSRRRQATHQEFM
ncbi:uncharacterized protein LOC132590167 [Heteronotia binoei]|uniref:uncharacterized protein LOC132590167 n=1 Tax=Heteronotia binoei TaxID=13085 RepID=UPI0029316DF8|nr:uncharacterized protein LOC132590167 [Heteronotia binoei]